MNILDKNKSSHHEWNNSNTKNSYTRKLFTSSICKAVAIAGLSATSLTCLAASVNATESFGTIPAEGLSSLQLAPVDAQVPVLLAAAEPAEVPPGFHRMPGGKLMANSKKSVAPAGYHLMPDGTLMPHGGGGGDHSGHGGGHHHGAGMWMFDYMYMRMEMDGMLDSTTEITGAQVIDPTGPYNFGMSATDMSMDMHMFMGMYGITDKTMVMVMAHYMSNTMGMLAGDGTTSTMESKGIGDTIVSAMIQGPDKMTFNVGVSIPTGSIDKRGPMTHSAAFTEQDAKYPYGMQLGSGTYDLKQGIRYMDSAGKFGWGAGYEYTGRLNENDKGYTLGNIFALDGWVRWDIHQKFNATVKLHRMETGNIEGADEDLANREVTPGKFMSPVMDPEHYGGIRTDLSVAVKYQPKKMLSITGEVTVPVAQDLNGPQMKTDSIIGFGIGLMF